MFCQSILLLSQFVRINSSKVFSFVKKDVRALLAVGRLFSNFGDFEYSVSESLKELH
jgi:hypothetical protein